MTRLAPLLLCLIMVGCSTTSSLNRRLTKNTELFTSLTPAEQALVQEGRIKEGMSRDAVYLAWGRPESVRQGSKSGVPYETWTYMGLEPVHHIGIGLGYGYGRGYGCYPYYGRYGGFYPYYGADFTRTPHARVEFLNNRVTAWQGRTNY